MNGGATRKRKHSSKQCTRSRRPLAQDDVRVASDRFIVVDSDAFIWLTRGKRRAADLRPFVEERRIVLSFVSVAELRRGAIRLGYNEESRRRMEEEIAATLVVAPNDALSNEWARVSDHARHLGHALGQSAQAHDAWVAATALYYRLPVLSLDSDFDGFPGLVLFPER